MEGRGIDKGVVKLILADVVVVIEWEMLEWLLEDELIIQNDRWGVAFLAEGEGRAKSESCVRSRRIRVCRVRETGGAYEISDFHIPGLDFILLAVGSHKGLQ